MIRRNDFWMHLKLVGLVLAGFSLSGPGTAIEPVTAIDHDPSQASGWLRLHSGDHSGDHGGDHVAGTFVDSPDTETLVWRHERFADPFRFQLIGVRGGAFPPSNQAIVGGDGFLVELVGGDRLVGQVTAIDSQTVTINAMGLGEVQVLRRAVWRISAPEPADVPVFVGPIGLTDWSSVGDKSDWENRGGRLSTSKDDASILRDDILPAKARIELQLSWQESPDFVLALGVGDGDEDLDVSTQAAFRVEIWDGQMVLLRESGDAADLVMLGNVSTFDNVLELRLDLDQVAGTVRCRVGDDPSPVELKLAPAAEAPIHRGIRLINLNGGVSLDAIQVLPLPPESTQATIENDILVTKDDREFRGRVNGIEGGDWVLVADETEHRISPNDVNEIRFAADRDSNQDSESDSEKGSSRGSREMGAVQENEEADLPTDVASPPDFRIITHSGSRLTGTWQGVSDGKLRLIVGSLTQPASIATSQISRLNQVGYSPVTRNAIAVRSARLEFPRGELRGKLIPSPIGTKPTPLRFQANGSTPVTFASDFVGCLFFREPPAPESLAQRRAREDMERAAQMQQARRAPKPDQGFMAAIGRAFGNNAQTQQRQIKSLHLLSGETIPCEIERIDEDGVVFASQMTKQTKLPHGIIRAVSLVSNWSGTTLGPEKQERLMTVPRVGKNRPPSHLVIAKNGDLLRCKLIRLTEKMALVETRLETIEIDRALIAEIVWLVNPSVTPTTNGDGQGNEDGLVVRAKMRNGNQFSLIPDQVTETAIVGSHPYLGDSEINLSDTDELIFGSYVSRTDHEQPFQRWKLRDAPEPMIAGSGEDGGRTPGTASVLVGKPAPDFTLDLLDGDRFQVSQQKGKVLVLDFWATWCGPCLQAMPVIDKTVAKFDSQQVMLVAVNMQETADPIRKTLQRLKLSPHVALDIDGVAAARYQADAIPQTVVIDRDGNIARVFVGSGGNLDEQLTAAIEEQLAYEE